jgi:hypothetical protein
LANSQPSPRLVLPPGRDSNKLLQPILLKFRLLRSNKRKHKLQLLPLLLASAYLLSASLVFRRMSLLIPLPTIPACTLSLVASSTLAALL